MLEKRTRSGPHEKTYLPAAGHDWLLPFYDPVVKLLGGNRIRKEFIEQADIRPGHNILEIGCGTGTVVVALKQSQPSAEVTGLDPDAKALERAKKKAGRNSLRIRFDQGFSGNLPYGDQSFDRVLSSLMFHHLDDREKEKTLREVKRVLKPGGSFHMVDFDQSKSNGFFARWFHSHEHLKDNSENRILTLLKEAGFSEPGSTGTGRNFFFNVRYYASVA
jgi:ubiquinone/menaquinone biosynthesis C-methylase UbiE